MSSIANRHVLALELGTSSLKIALVAENGSVSARATRGVATRFVPPGGAEQDPGEIWSSVREAVREVVSAASVTRESIVAVACTSQYSSIVPVGADGEAVGPLLLWMDGRGGRYSREIWDRHPEAVGRWLERHGIPPLPSGGDALSKILWIRHERPEVYGRTGAFLEAMDWILARLTGRLTTNVGTAFMLLLTDTRHLDRLEWNQELIDLASIDPGKLAPLVPASSVVGTLRPDVAAELGMSTATKVLSATNDTQAASLATGAFRPGRGAINVGTTSQVLAALEERRIDLDSQLVSMPSPLRGGYLVMAENGIAARALDHFLRSIVFACDPLADHSRDDPFAGLDRCVEGVPVGAGGLLYLPWLTGTVAPDGNPQARGAFVNVSLSTDRGHMVRAILEGVALSLRWLLPAVEKLVGRSFGELRFSGGGARSAAWAQILADVLDRPLLPLADPVHSNNRASALLAFDALGLVSLEESLERFCPARGRLEPRREHQGLYEERYAQFRAAYEGLRPVFDSLNGGVT